MNRIHDAPPNDTEMVEHVRHHLEQGLRCHRNRDVPIITLTYAQSIDGCIAALGGGTLQLSNGASQRLTHQVRALYDAILVGVNTVLTDDPRLTVRLVKGKNPQPIVVDSRLRFPLEANLLRDPCVRPIIATGNDACVEKERKLVKAGARVIRVSLQDDGLVDLSCLLIRLKQLGLRSVMVEGGAMIITNVLATQLADQLLLTICPRFVGGLQAVKPLPHQRRMPSLSNPHYQSLAGDLIVRGDLERQNTTACDPPSSQVIAPDPSQVF